MKAKFIKDVLNEVSIPDTTEQSRKESSEYKEALMKAFSEFNNQLVTLIINDNKIEAITQLQMMVQSKHSINQHGEELKHFTSYKKEEIENKPFSILFWLNIRDTETKNKLMEITLSNNEVPYPSSSFAHSFVGNIDLPPETLDFIHSYIDALQSYSGWDDKSVSMLKRYLAKMNDSKPEPVEDYLKFAHFDGGLKKS